MKEIPVKPSKASIYKLTKQNKEYLKSLAVDGVIPIDDYLTALNNIGKSKATVGRINGNMRKE